MTDQLFHNRYRLIEEVGRGSFGVVHRAMDSRLNREVALKILYPALSVDPETLRLFDREAQTLAALDHPHIVAVYDAGTHEGQRYIVMRYVAGRSLAGVVAKEGPQPPERVLNWLAQIAPALAYAHERKVVHRDLKPGNLLLDEGAGRVILSDFGLARAVQQSGGSSGGSLTGRGSVGTPAYMPPEVLQGGVFTSAGDLYSLGCILYELLSGRPPYTGENEWAVGLQHLSAPIPTLDLPTTYANLAAVVTHLLAKDPAQRPASLADVLAEAKPSVQLSVISDQSSVPNPPIPNTQSPSPQSPVTSHRSPISFDWVTISAGDFTMGSDKSKDMHAFDDEMPQHHLYLPEYGIARVPVTVAQFEIFVKTTGYVTTAEEKGTAYSYVDKKWQWVKGANWRQPRGTDSNVCNQIDRPVTCVSWFDAVSFCKWAQVRLPSEAEWEKAARGTDGRIYPWGTEEPTDRLCNFNMNVKDATTVGRYPKGASPYGLLDMAGNVWEWIRDAKRDYPYDAEDGRQDQRSSAEGRVLRGGSFRADERNVRCAIRDRSDEGFRGDNIGFRVAASSF